MRNALLGVVSALLLAAPTAQAADMALKAPPPPAAVFSWTGFYIGADVGAAWANETVTSNPSAFTFQAPVSGTLNGSSAIGGLYAGYNFSVAPNWLIGIEGDFNWTNINDTTTAPNLFPNGTPVGSGGITWNRDLKSLASLRGRLGFNPAPQALLYLTGGGAWGWSTQSATDAFSGGCPNCDVAAPFNASRSGYVIGGGAEWAFNQHWIARAEYLYYQLQGTSAVATFPTNPLSVVNFTWGHMSINTARVGLAYKF